MKIIKGIFRLIVALILLMCAGITFCAFNPSLTDKLASVVAKVEITEYQSEQEMGSDAEGNGESGEDGGEAKGDIYVQPEPNTVKPPEEVADKIGYEPIADSGQEIDDDSAADLLAELETGNLGEDCTFDELYYPYYAMFEAPMQGLYRQIYANALELTTSFTPVVDASVEQVKTVFEAVYNDHPELFWLETGYSCQYLQSGKCVEITLKYNRTADELEEAKKQFATATELILKDVRSLDNAYLQEKAIHDALIARVDYNERVSMNQSAYSAMVGRQSVCAGYARAFQYLLQQLEIPCYYCTGYSGGDHAWNIVKLEDGYYNVDVTWDDTEVSTYAYFNKTDAEYMATHMRKGLSVYLPACRGDKYVIGEDSTTEENPIDSPEADSDNIFTEPTAEEIKAENLKRAGLKADEVSETLEDYYAKCLSQMKSVGTGEKQFVNAIPKSLWDSVEAAYNDESYRKGYVDEALSELGVKNFAIQLQVQRLDGGYYKLYHTISTW